jgi:hypothetical protein
MEKNNEMYKITERLLNVSLKGGRVVAIAISTGIAVTAGIIAVLFIKRNQSN